MPELVKDPEKPAPIDPPAALIRMDVRIQLQIQVNISSGNGIPSPTDSR